jgi:4-amino-4-deoxy-L-arabinose transferase-like glycosyltransferase
MQMRAWRRLVEVILPVAVLIAGFVMLDERAGRASFFGDEGRAIWLTRYFDFLFIRHDLTNPEWGDNYWTHDYPFVSPYIIGGWLRVRGVDLDNVPPPYRFEADLKDNRREGRVPDEALLAEARAPIVALGAGAIALLYLLGRVLGGVIAGLAAGGLALAGPLSRAVLTRAVSDSPLVFFLLLGLLLGVLGARRGRVGGLPIGWAVAVGVALGLALGTKLTAALSLAAVVGWGGLAALLAARSHRSSDLGARLGRGWAAGRGWALALAVALLVFVLGDPHLYSNPLLHTAHLFQHRAEEMRRQQRVYPRDAVLNPLERPGHVLASSLIDGTWAGSHGLPLEAGLASLGVAALLVRIRRSWRRTGALPAEGLVLLTVLVYFVGVSAGLLLGWTNYFLPTFLLGSLLSGLGLSALARELPVVWAAVQGRGAVVRATEPQPG